MKAKLLILGKGDNVITMITDNLASRNDLESVTIFNNLDLPVIHKIDHPKIKIEIKREVDLNSYDFYCLGVYQPKYKKAIIENMNPELSKFKNIIHKGLILSDSATLGIGLLINSRVSISAHAAIGHFVSINRHVSIGHHAIIGDYVSINPGCHIAGHVVIGEGSTIGMGANILNDVKIGKNSTIGAGSVVTKDVPDHVVAYGNPCRTIRENL